MNFRYRLQVREQTATPNILGNHSFPVYSYRWRDIAASDDRSALEEVMPAGKDYRIVEVGGNEQ